MPKTGLGRAEWLNRLKAYAAGNFTFSTGQKPPTGTFWAKEIVKIDNCPGNAKQKKLSGEVARCTCTWHPARVPVAAPKPVIPPNTAVQPTSSVSHLVVPTQHPSSSAPRVAVSSQQQAFYVPPGTASTQHPSSSAPRVAVSSQQQAFYVPPGAASTQHPSSSAPRVAVSSQQQAFYVPPGAASTQHPSSSAPRVAVSSQQQAFYVPPGTASTQHPSSSAPRVAVSSQQQAFYVPPGAASTQHPSSSAPRVAVSSQQQAFYVPPGAASTQHPSSSAPRVAVSSQQQAFYVPPGTASTQHPSSSAPRVAVSSQQQAFYVPPGAASTQHPSSSAPRVAVSSQQQAFYVPPGAASTQHPSSSAPRVAVSSQQQAFYVPPGTASTQHPSSSAPRVAVSSQQQAFYVPPGAASTQHPSSSAPRVAVSSQQQAFYVPPGAASTQHPSSSAPRVAVSSQQQVFYVPPGAASTQHPSSSASRVAVSSQRQAFYVPPGVGPTQHPSSSAPRVTVSGQQQAFYKPPVADPSQHPLSSQGTTLPTPAFPVGWHRNMGAADCEWVSKQVFTADKKLREPIQLWNHPPQPRLQSATPSPKTLFLKRLFLWMPRKAWKIDLLCPQCNKSLKPKGLYNRVRLVLDISSYYYMATEYLHCPGCKATIIGWDERVIQQLPTAMQSMFPAVLTHKYACDRTVVGMLRSRTLGNSPTALQHNIQELHSEQWLRLQLCYLSQCDAHKQCLQAQQLSAVVYEKAPDLAVLPMARWFLAAYVRDVWTRHDSILASLSSVFGSIIKMDSTKKLVRKLQGSAAGSAAWATSVGNERGEILQCVLTISESNAGLKEMAEGLMDRYERSRIPPPKVLYVDRDCCTQDQHSRCQTLFSKWGDLLIRLDIWHYMRRLSQTCISESHPLYGTFMQRLSRCIFEWDENDYERLIDATTADMVQEGIKAPLREHILKLILKYYIL